MVETWKGFDEDMTQPPMHTQSQSFRERSDPLCFRLKKAWVGQRIPDYVNTKSNSRLSSCGKACPSSEPAKSAIDKAGGRSLMGFDEDHSDWGFFFFFFFLLLYYSQA